MENNENNIESNNDFNKKKVKLKDVEYIIDSVDTHKLNFPNLLTIDKEKDKFKSEEFNLLKKKRKKSNS